MRAGRLRHRIAIFSSTFSSGVPSTELLTAVGIFPCEIAPMSGKEFQGLGGTNNILTHKITMRYVNNIRPDMVGIWEGRRFRFTTVINPEERSRELQIIAVESK